MSTMSKYRHKFPNGPPQPVDRWILIPGSDNEYYPCISGGKGEVTVETQFPAKTADELELDKLNLEFAKEGLAETRALRADQAKYQPLLDMQLENLPATRELNAENIDIQRLLNKELRRFVETGGAPSEAQLSQIEEARTSALAAGESDISKFSGDMRRLILEEMAAARGFRATDSPIMDELERVGEEAPRQQGLLSRNLAQASSSARLNLPMGMQQMLEGSRQFQGNLNMAAQDFQSRLRQQAFMNRLSMAQSPTLSMNLASNMAGQRIAAPTTQTRQPFSFFTDVMPMITGMAGGAGQGMGYAAGRMMFA